MEEHSNRKDGWWAIGVVSSIITILGFLLGWNHIGDIIRPPISATPTNASHQVATVRPTILPTISKTSQPTDRPIPSFTPSQPAEELAYFGQNKNLGGLVITVGPPDYNSGCGGKLDFEVTLSNETDNPIVLGFDANDIKLLGNGKSSLRLSGTNGPATPKCAGGLKIETLAPHSAVKFALRTTDNVSKFNYLELIFGDETGRLSGENWKLDLNSNSYREWPRFGETVNVDGLEVTVGDENYFPGCKGTLGFQVTLKNTTSEAIILGMRSDDLDLYGDDQKHLSLYSELGKTSTDCYGSFRVETIRPGETILIAARNTASLSGLSFVDFVFEADNRLYGQRWRLTLPR